MMNAERVQEQNIKRRRQIIVGSSTVDAALLMTCEDSIGIWHESLLQ